MIVELKIKNLFPLNNKMSTQNWGQLLFFTKLDKKPIDKFGTQG